MKKLNKEKIENRVKDIVYGIGATLLTAMVMQYTAIQTTVDVAIDSFKKRPFSSKESK